MLSAGRVLALSAGNSRPQKVSSASSVQSQTLGSVTRTERKSPYARQDLPGVRQVRTSSAKAEFKLTLSNSKLLATVDEDDFYRFRGFNWYLKSDGYIVTDSTKQSRSRGVPVKLKLHRLVIGIEDGPDVDHINGNKLDNRKENLRKCTRSENLCNRISSKEIRGVYYRKESVNFPWFSAIQIPGKKPRRQKYLGSFKTREEAAMAFIKASKEIHGEFSPYRNIEVVDAL